MNVPDVTARYLCAALSLVASACAPSDEPASVEVRDSAGIRIVTSRAPANEPGTLTVGPDPILSLGGEGTELHLVRGATMLSADRLLVATSTELLLYGPDGRLLRRHGGEGEGPGEYRLITAVVRDSQGIVVWDLLRSRTYYSPELELIGEESIDAARVRAVAPYFAVPHPITREVVLISANRMLEHEPATGDVFRPPWLHALLRLDTGKADTLVEHGGGFEEVYFGNSRSVARYLSPYWRAAVGPNDHIFITDGSTLELHEFDVDGRLVRIVRRDVPLRPITAEELELARTRSVSILRQSRSEAEVERQLRMIPAPTTFPALDDLVVDATGLIWARETVGPKDSTTTWAVFSPDGQWLTQVTVPGILKPLEIGSDYMVASRRDELDREFIHVFNVHRDLPQNQ